MIFIQTNKNIYTRAGHASKAYARAYALLMALLLCSFSALADNSGGVLYRYTDDEGVKVLNHTIPPEYAQQGYEILNKLGQVIKVVPPAPTDGEIAQAVAERRLRQRFEILKRRYSNVKEIERAKQRRLDNLSTNIAILKGNISGAKTRIENIMSKAAEMERGGLEVSENLLVQLEEAKTELSIAEAALKTRLEEQEEVSNRFDKDLTTFVAGSELEKKRLEEELNNTYN